jgi:hypothetical protein
MNNQYRNPKLEIRNKPGPNKRQFLRQFQNTNPKHLVLRVAFFHHLDLFRISDFVLRISCFISLALPSTLLKACFARVTASQPFLRERGQ